MRGTLSSVGALVLATVAYGADVPTLWQYIHPQARFVAGGDLKKAKTSLLWKTVQKELGANPSQVKLEGADLLDMVDRFLISSSAAPGEANATSLIAFEGSIDRFRIKKSLAPGTLTERFKGADLFVPPKSRNTDMLFALVNDRFALVGDRASIADALTAAVPPPAALIARAKELASRGEFFVVVDGVASMVEANSSAAPMMRDIERVELVLALQKGIDMDVSLVTRSPESAHALIAMIESAKYMLGSQTKDAAPGADLLKMMLVTAVGGDVHLTWSMPAAQVQQTVAAARDGAMQAATGLLAGLASGAKPSLGWVEGSHAAAKSPTASAATPAAPAVSVAPAPPPVPQKRTIKIVGLESGDKEVTYTTHPKPGGQAN